MKRFIAFMLSLLIISGNMAVTANNDKYEDAIFRVTALGLFQGYENEEMAPEKNITRAEFASIAIRLMGVDDTNLVNKSIFGDVSNEHWASGNIFYANALGLVEGFNDNTFRPDDYITNQDALKILICAIGYDFLAQEAGGYPYGYAYEAARLGISKGVQFNMESYATRGDIAIFVDNALEVALMEKTYGNENTGYSIDANNTLLKRITEKKSIVEYEGVLLENEFTSLVGGPALSKGQVKIDSTIFKVGETDISSHLGQRVRVYAFEDDDNGAVIRHYKVHEKSNQITISANNVLYIDFDRLKYEKDGKESELKISKTGVYYIYNNKAVPNEQITIQDLTIHDGQYRLVDFSNDGIYDIVFIEERESFVINRINHTNNSVYFENDDLFRGQSGLRFTLNEDDNYYAFFDKDNNEKTFDSLKENMVITIVASKDLSHITVYMADEYVEGTVTEVDFTNNKIMIKNTGYSQAKTIDGGVKLDVAVGDSERYLLDAFGRIVSIDFNLESAEQYAYVIDVGEEGGLSKGLKVKVVEKGDSYKEVEQKGNTEYTYHYYQNSNAKILEIADTVVVSVNGGNASVRKVNEAELLNKIIKYSLNTDGKISKIDIFSLNNTNTQYFNSDIKSFGGYFNIDGFLIGNRTKVICVPKMADSEEDYYQKVKLVNGSRYDICAVDVDSRTQIANAVVIYENMDADSLAGIDSNADICVVGNISQVIVDEEYYYKIEILNGAQKEEHLAKTGGILENRIRQLESGSIIKYSTDAFDIINNIDILASVSDLGQYGRANKNAPDEEVYGVVYDIKINRLSNGKNAMIDDISVVFNKEGAGEKVYYEILRKDGPIIYLYDRKEKRITNSTTDDISSYIQVGADASEIFMLVNNNDPEVVVIIKN